MMADKESIKTLYKYVHYALCVLVVFLVSTTVGNLMMFISKQTLSQWDEESSVLLRFLENVLLLAIFILQHSVMATEGFKTMLSSWFKITVSERLVYVICTCVSLIVLILKWQSIPETYLWIFGTQHRNLLWLFFLLLHSVCWFMLLLEVLCVNVGEMVGVSQIYCFHNSLNPVMAGKVRKLREIYSRMRHPGAVLLTVMLWIHPLMTLDRVLLACTLTSYVIGRHSFDETHYEFAEKYFTTQQHIERRTRSFTRHVHNN